MHTFKTLCILDVLFYIAYSTRYSLFVLMCRKPISLTHSLTTTEVTLQNKGIITCNYNPYRAMIETLLNFGQDAKSSQLMSSLFIKDDFDHPEDPDPNGANNGLFLRSKFTETSKKAHFP